MMKKLEKIRKFEKLNERKQKLNINILFLLVSNTFLDKPACL